MRTGMVVIFAMIAVFVLVSPCDSPTDDQTETSQGVAAVDTPSVMPNRTIDPEFGDRHVLYRVNQLYVPMLGQRLVAKIQKAYV
jgi:hypothetical protein